MTFLHDTPIFQTKLIKQNIGGGDKNSMLHIKSLSVIAKRIYIGFVTKDQFSNNRYIIVANSNITW